MIGVILVVGVFFLYLLVNISDVYGGWVMDEFFVVLFFVVVFMYIFEFFGEVVMGYMGGIGVGYIGG